MDILFVTATRIGDAVLSTGLIAHLIERYPGARLTIAAGPVAAPLFDAVPGCKRVLIVEKRRWSLHWLPLYGAVATRRWDIVVDLRGSALAWLLRAGERRVMAKGDARRASRAPARAPFRPRSAARPIAVDRTAPRSRRRGTASVRRPGAGDRPGGKLARQAMARRTLCRAGAAADRTERSAAGSARRGAGRRPRARAGPRRCSTRSRRIAESTWSGGSIC